MTASITIEDIKEIVNDIQRLESGNEVLALSIKGEMPHEQRLRTMYEAKAQAYRFVKKS